MLHLLFLSGQFSIPGWTLSWNGQFSRKNMWITKTGSKKSFKDSHKRITTEEEIKLIVKMLYFKRYPIQVSHGNFITPLENR